MQANRVASVFFQTNAIRVALVEENFGDFNEKAFYDIVTYEEMFDWLRTSLCRRLPRRRVARGTRHHHELQPRRRRHPLPTGARRAQHRVPLTALTSRMMMNGGQSGTAT